MMHRLGKEAVMDMDRPGVMTEGEVTDAITLLTNDHRRVDDLFRRYEGLGLGDEDERGRLVDQMGDELNLHAAIEETTFYPAVRELLAQGDELVAESLHELDVVRAILAELEEMEPEWGRFDATVSRLISTVRHHVNEEERDMFPKLESAIGAPQLLELGRRMQRTRDREAGAAEPMLAIEEEDIAVTLFERPQATPAEPMMPEMAPSTRRPSPKRPTRKATGTTGRKAPSAKKATGRKSTRKKSTAKRAAPRKSTATRAAAKKSTRKRSTAKRAGAKKSTGRKSTRKRSTARKASAKKSTARRSAATRKSSGRAKSRARTARR